MRLSFESKILHIVVATLVGVLLSFEALAIRMIPEWVRPEGIAARAIWGGIVLAALKMGAIGGVVGGVATGLLPSARARKFLIAAGAFLVATLALVIVGLSGA